MKRAAEEAMPQARGIFVDTIRGMSFADVWATLRGDTAATSYSRARMAARLTTVFTFILLRSMDNVGAAHSCKTPMNRYSNMPFVN